MTPEQRTAWLDQEDASVAATVRRHGTHITYVGGVCSCPYCTTEGPAEGDGPTFGYTTGLFGMGYPELLIFGLDAATTATVLNELRDRVREGADLVPGEIITFEQWTRRIVPERVPNPGEIVFTANRFYRRSARRSVPVLQLSYDDEDGHFPWEPSCSAAECQPRPGTFRA